MDKIINILILSLLLITNKSFAQDENMCIDEYTTKINDYYVGLYYIEEENLYKAMLSTVVLRKQKNKIVYYKFCREYGDNKLCEMHIREYASQIMKYSLEFNLDPWLMAAIALHESNYNAFLKGSKGEMGLFQLHPYSPWGKKSFFVKNKTYRNDCKAVRGHCQVEVVGIAAELLRSLLDTSGSLEKALTSYNTGHFLPIRDSYVYSVLTKRKILLENIKHDL